jgi:acetyl-CoA synthetase
MMLKCLGYRIGPFDVENSLIADTRVAEVAVVGVPDKEGLRGEVKVLLIL